MRTIGLRLIYMEISREEKRKRLERFFSALDVAESVCPVPYWKIEGELLLEKTFTTEKGLEEILKAFRDLTGEACPNPSDPDAEPVELEVLHSAPEMEEDPRLVFAIAWVWKNPPAQ